MNALVEVPGPRVRPHETCHAVPDKDSPENIRDQDGFDELWDDHVLHILDTVLGDKPPDDGAADDDDAAADDDDEADDDRMEGGRAGVHRAPGRRQDLQLPRRSVPRVRPHGRARPQEADHPRLRQGRDDGEQPRWARRAGGLPAREGRDALQEDRHRGRRAEDRSRHRVHERVHARRREAERPEQRLRSDQRADGHRGRAALLAGRLGDGRAGDAGTRRLRDVRLRQRLQPRRGHRRSVCLV